MTDPTSSRDQGDSWSDDEITQLRELAGCSTPAHIIGPNLGRGEALCDPRRKRSGSRWIPDPNRRPVSATALSKAGHTGALLAQITTNATPCQRPRNHGPHLHRR